LSPPLPAPVGVAARKAPCSVDLAAYSTATTVEGFSSIS
jgi:hypothetical protein